MSAKNKDTRINLIPKDEFESTTAGRILTWMVSSFRIILTLVEVVVMAAFFSRFYLDTRISDLDDEIEAKTAQIQSQSEFEKRFRNIQNRLSIYDSITQKRLNFTNTVNKIASVTPLDVFLKSMSENSDSVSLNGLSPSEISIAQFIFNLESSDNFKEVNLSDVKIEGQDMGLIEFSATMQLKK